MATDPAGIDGFLPGQVALHLTRGLEPMDPGEHVLFLHPCRHLTDTEATRYWASSAGSL